MDRLGHRTPVHAAQPVKLRELGYDERWLQDWLASDPTRLGLGQVVVLAQELTHAHGGSLDILAADGDTYYSIEVQLGEVDASHGFRVLDYWARNRARSPDKTHVAVLLVESADGRFRQALEAIAEYLPLIVVALRAWRGASEVVLVPEPLIVNESLDIGGTVGLASGKVRTEQDWREQLTEEAWAFYEAFVAWTREHLGEVRVDYSPKSYIGLRRGRRVWAPLWFRRDGATVYLPDPDGSRAEEPSVAMENFRERLHDESLEAAWQRTYNAGSNPISMRLRRSDLDKPVVQELLRASFEISNLAWLRGQNGTHLRRRYKALPPMKQRSPTQQIRRRTPTNDGAALSSVQDRSVRHRTALCCGYNAYSTQAGRCRCWTLMSAIVMIEPLLESLDRWLGDSTDR